MSEDAAVTIRPARLPGEAEDLARVYLSSAEHHAGLDPDRYRIPMASAVATWFRGHADGRRRSVLVAEADDRIVGLVSITRLAPPTAASMLADVPTASVDVAVDPGYRRRGIGRRLLGAAEERARELGAVRIQLDAHAANDGALRLYADLGYRTFGVLLSKDVDAT
ncbi:GNAT family N-acetyltransferase [Jiangella asiatica]|uniref:GNAT family N-acetyltransferase n=1 Tax=Jiangella asiatica TaxID=2530372 RepID=A0A4V2YYU2_9ACTN|nr:GNAT family N-acetyltransferase [Jiangella asiatica]TDD94527.1 GNAT family N-acetyltransferase [Jiangella asiatica]